MFTGRTDAEAEAPILCTPDVKSRLIRKDPHAGKYWLWGEEDGRGWDGWMASLTGWTWVWASSGRWWGTGKPGVLQSTGSKRVGHNWVAEQQQQRFTQHLGMKLVPSIRSSCIVSNTNSSNSNSSYGDDTSRITDSFFLKLIILNLFYLHPIIWCGIQIKTEKKLSFLRNPLTLKVRPFRFRLSVGRNLSSSNM